MTLQDFFFSDPHVELIGAGLFVVGGIAVLLYGIFLSKQTALPSHLRSGWKQYFAGFRTNDTLDAGEDEVMRLAQRQWVRGLGATTVGMGIGMLGGVAAMGLLLLVALHAPFSLPPAMELLIFTPLFWSMIIGPSLGRYFGSRRHRFTRFDDAMTDGSPSRRISEYRSPLLVLIVAIPFLFCSAVTLIFALRYVAFTPGDIRDFGIIPPPHRILAIYPCTLLLTLILVEACVWIELKSSVAIRSQDAALARYVNMKTMRQQMAGYYYMALISFPTTGMGVVRLFTPTSVLAALSGQWGCGCCCLSDVTEWGPRC